MKSDLATLETETTFTRFDRMSEMYPDNVAVVYLGKSFNYRHLRDMSERFAGALSGMGVGKGDRVMLYLSNSIQWVVAYLGVQKLGAVAVPVSPIYTSQEIEYMMNDAGAETVVCMDTNFCYVQETFGATGLKRAIVTNLVDLLPAWKRLLGFLFDILPSGKVDRDKRVFSFRSMLQHPPLQNNVPIDPAKDLSYILYTGGTTGFPKGVPGTHIGWTSYVNDVTEDVAGDHLLEGKDTYIAINPLFHIMALGLFMSIGLNRGNTTMLMPVPQIDAILETIQRYRVRWLLGVPALYRMILENDRVDRYDLGSLKYCYCGGDVLPEEVKERWRERCGLPIYQVYGSTEAGHVAYSKIGIEPSPRAIGFPLQSRECLIVDPATLQPVPRNESGELLVTSPYTLKEYYNKPEETRKAYVELDGKTWCRMGDFVSQEDSGELIYVERSADIIKHKGFRVSASEVEATLQDHPTVIGACVVGIPDRRVGERIKAIVVLKEDARGVGGAELINFCRERLANYKVPGYIEFRDMLPKSKVGKLLRREVRDDEKRRMAKEKQKHFTKERRAGMDLFVAIQERRSCRAFVDEPIPDDIIGQILESAVWAPSPANAQPWEFTVVTSPEKRKEIHAEGERCRQWAIGASGWKWLEKYSLDFLSQAPVIIAVTGNPKKTGMDMFQEEGTVGYQHACAAAIQNMLLSAHALGLGSLWFTLFDNAPMRKILDIPQEKTPIALVCIGKPAGDVQPVPRKSLEKVVRYIR